MTPDFFAPVQRRSMDALPQEEALNEIVRLRAENAQLGAATIPLVADERRACAMSTREEAMIAEAKESAYRGLGSLTRLMAALYDEITCLRVELHAEQATSERMFTPGEMVAERAEITRLRTMLTVTDAMVERAWKQLVKNCALEDCDEYQMSISPRINCVEKDDLCDALKAALILKDERGR